MLLVVLLVQTENKIHWTLLTCGYVMIYLSDLADQKKYLQSSGLQN